MSSPRCSVCHRALVAHEGDVCPDCQRAQYSAPAGNNPFAGMELGGLGDPSPSPAPVPAPAAPDLPGPAGDPHPARRRPRPAPAQKAHSTRVTVTGLVSHANSGHDLAGALSRLSSSLLTGVPFCPAGDVYTFAVTPDAADAFSYDSAVECVLAGKMMSGLFDADHVTVEGRFNREGILQVERLVKNGAQPRVHGTISGHVLQAIAVGVLLLIAAAVQQAGSSAGDSAGWQQSLQAAAGGALYYLELAAVIAGLLFSGRISRLLHLPLLWIVLPLLLALGLLVPALLQFEILLVLAWVVLRILAGILR